MATLLEVGTGFHPELTGRENVFLNGAILGLSRREIASRFDDDRRVLRRRGVHRHAGQALLERHVRAARLRRRRAPRRRDHARRRGARRRRRRVPAQVHEQDPRPHASRRGGRSCSSATTSRGSSGCATASFLIEHGAVAGRGPGRAGHRRLPERRRPGAARRRRSRSRTTRRGSEPARRGSGASGCSTRTTGSRPARCCSTSRSCVEADARGDRDDPGGDPRGRDRGRRRPAPHHGVQHRRRPARRCGSSPGVHELRAELEPELLPGEFVLDLGVHERVTRRGGRPGRARAAVRRRRLRRRGRDVRGDRARLPARRDALGARQAAATARLDCMRLRTPGRRRPSVLFAGQSYYHAWYLSRELRKLGWRADVLNWDVAPDSQGFYHGEDYAFTWDPSRPRRSVARHAGVLPALDPAATTSSTSPTRTACGSATRCTTWVANRFHPYAEIELLRAARQEDRVLEQRLPRRRVADLVRVLGRPARVPRLPVARAAGDLQRRAQPRVGLQPQPAGALPVQHGRQPQGLQRRPDGPRGPAVLLPGPRVLAARPRDPGALAARPPDEHRAHLPRGRALPEAHGRTAATSSPATSTSRSSSG